LGLLKESTPNILSNNFEYPLKPIHSNSLIKS
jgi:hypothetical protein